MHPVLACGKPCKTNSECDETCPVCRLSYNIKDDEQYLYNYDYQGNRNGGLQTKICTKRERTVSQSYGSGLRRKKAERGHRRIRQGGGFGVRNGVKRRRGRDKRGRKGLRAQLRRRKYRQPNNIDYNDDHNDDYEYGATGGDNYG